MPQLLSRLDLLKERGSRSVLAEPSAEFLGEHLAKFACPVAAIDRDRVKPLAGSACRSGIEARLPKVSGHLNRADAQVSDPEAGLRGFIATTLFRFQSPYISSNDEAFCCAA